MKLIFLLILISCGANIKDSLKENGKIIEKNTIKDKADENSGKKGIGGFIVHVINFVIPSAHAQPICRSVKSQNSNYYAELFEVTSAGDLNSKNLSSGFKKICDVDVKNDDSYFFEIDPSDLGDALIKIRIVDNRPNSIHNQKEIINYASDKDFTINVEKTLQTKMIEERLVAENSTYHDMKETNKLNAYKSEYHDSLIRLIINNNKALLDNKLSELINSTYVVKLKVDEFYDLNQMSYQGHYFTVHKDFNDILDSVKKDPAKYVINDYLLSFVDSCFKDLDVKSDKYDKDLRVCKDYADSTKMIICNFYTPENDEVEIKPLRLEN